MADGGERELDPEALELDLRALGGVSKHTGSIVELLANPGRDHLQLHRWRIVEGRELAVESAEFGFAARHRVLQGCEPDAVLHGPNQVV